MRPPYLATWLWIAAAVAPAATAADNVRLTGHTDAVLCAAFSPDSKTIVSGSMDKLAILWDVQTGKRRGLLEGHTGGIVAVEFSADSSRVITGSLDHTARVWDSRTGELLAILNGLHHMHVHAAAISADGTRALTASCDQTVSVWDVAAERSLGSYPIVGDVWAMGFSPDGKQFYTGHSDLRAGGKRDKVGKNLRFYDTATGNVVHEYDVPSVDEAHYVDGGKRLLAVCGGELWSVDPQAQKVTHQARPKGVDSYWHLGPSPDAKTAMVGRGLNAEYDDLVGGKRLREFPAMREMIRVAAVSPDLKWGMFAGGGNSAYAWDEGWTRAADPEIRLVSLTGEAPPIAAADRYKSGEMKIIRLTADTKHLLSTNGNDATWWDTATGKETGRFKIGKGGMLTVAAAPDGGRAAVVRPRGFTVFDAKTGAVVCDVKDMPAVGADAAFTPDGKQLVIAGGNLEPNSPATTPGDLRLYDATTGKEIRQFANVGTGMRGVNLAPDGKTVVAVTVINGRGMAQAWEVDTGKPLWTWKGPQTNQQVYCGTLTFSPDAKRVAISMGFAAYVVDNQNGKEIAALDRNQRWVMTVQFDPDGKRVWTASMLDAVRSWDLETGKVLATHDLSLAGFPQTLFIFRDGHRTVLDTWSKPPREHDLGK